MVNKAKNEITSKPMWRRARILGPILSKTIRKCIVRTIEIKNERQYKIWMLKSVQSILKLPFGWALSEIENPLTPKTGKNRTKSATKGLHFIYTSNLTNHSTKTVSQFWGLHLEFTFPTIKGLFPKYHRFPTLSLVLLVLTWAIIRQFSEISFSRSF